MVTASFFFHDEGNLNRFSEFHEIFQKYLSIMCKVLEKSHRDGHRTLYKVKISF